jgi:hypothetical protein
MAITLKDDTPGILITLSITILSVLYPRNFHVITSFNTYTRLLKEQTVSLLFDHSNQPVPLFPLAARILNQSRNSYVCTFLGLDV